MHANIYYIYILKLHASFVAMVSLQRLYDLFLLVSILKIFFKFLMYLDQEQKCTSNNLNLVKQFPRPGQVSKSCYCINYQDLAQAALLLNIGFKLHL